MTKEDSQSDIHFDDLSRDLRRLILAAWMLTQSSLPIIEGFPMPFVSPYLLKNLENAINPFREELERYYSKRYLDGFD